MITAIQAKRARALRECGYSLTEIATEIEGKPDRWHTFYYHVRDIPPPPEGWKRKGNPKPWNHPEHANGPSS